MTDEIIKNIFTTSFGEHDSAAKQYLNDSKTRLTALQERQRHIGDLLPQVAGLITDIVRRGNQVQSEEVSAFYERELTNLIHALNNVVTTGNEEIVKARGAIIAAESLIKIYSSSSNRFDAELQKARDIQAKQAEGNLGKVRKPGHRPDKLKDVRSYALPESDTEE